MEECEFVFNIICVSETWCSNTELQNNSNLSLTGFDSVPYERSKKNRGGGVLIFIKKNLSYKIRKDLSESDEHKEILSLEVSCKNSSNILLSCCYKPPKGDNDILSMFLKQVFKKSTAEKKPYYLIGDLNISIFFSIITSKLPQNSSPLWLKKHFFNESNLASFKNQISSINWDILNSTQSSTNCLYETFLNIFSEIYDVNFPLTEI